MDKLGVRVLLGVLFGAVVFAVLGGFWADLDAVLEHVASFNWLVFFAALGLAFGNYMIRFAKWEYYLRLIGVRLGRAESLGVFLSSFLLTVTPGKIGEVVKSVFLKKSRGIPVSVTAPIVLAERLTDLIALMCLALIGISTYRYGVEALAASAALVALGLAILSVPKVSLGMIAVCERLPVIGRVAPKLRTAYGSMRTLIAPLPLVFATIISIAAWSLECIAFFLVIRGFQDADPELLAATFLYAVATILGAISFLPGGLGVTEGSMAVLLEELGLMSDQASAVAATCLIRLATLWFAVLVGLVAFLWYRRVFLSAGSLYVASSESPGLELGEAEEEAEQS